MLENFAPNYPRKIPRAAVFVTDYENKIVRVNSAFHVVTGYRPDDAIGKTPDFLRADRDDRLFFSKIWREIFTAWRWQGEIWFKLPNGELYLADVSITAVADSDRLDAPTQLIYSIADVTERRLENEIKVFQATRDEITGLPNSNFFRDQIDQVFETARRTGSSVMVLKIMIRQYDMLLTGLGYRGVMKLAREVANRLREIISAPDNIARLQPDLFAVVLDVISREQGVHLAEKIHNALSHRFHVDGRDHEVEVAIGAAFLPHDGRTPAELLNNAGNALHFACDANSDHLVFYNPELTKQVRDLVEMQYRLRRALINDEFQLHYQPKVDLLSGKVAGMEALIRWNDPELGLVMPAQFIPVAEKTGLIDSIGQWVLTEACRQNMEWQNLGMPPIQVSVNVSPGQFRRESLVGEVAETLAKSGLEPGWLELEITESMLADHGSSVIEKLNKLRSTGVNLSIDDFGTSYSNLGYLPRFPLHTLKIDRSFVKEVDHNKDMAAITRMVIDLSHTLGLKVVAEGAEEDSHIAFLQDHGCDYVQGYYYSKPLPAEQFAEYVGRIGVAAKAA